MKSRSILFLIIVFFFSFLKHAHAFLEKLPPEVIWRIINHIPPNPLKLKTIHQRNIIPDDFSRIQTMTSLRVVNKYLAGVMSGEDSLLLIKLESPYEIFVNREDSILLPWTWKRGNSDLKPSLRYFPVHVHFNFVPDDNDLRRLAKIQPNIRSLNFSFGYDHERPDDIIRDAPISTFTSLTKLHIHKLDSSTDHFLYSLTNLQDLNLAIGPYPMHSIHHIPQLTKLHTLHLWGTDLKVFPSLSRLINLKTLTVSDEELTSTAPFTGIPHLTALKLHRSIKLREIDQLSALTTLQDLNLSYTAVTSLQSLTTLQNLKNLSLGQVKTIVTFTPLSRLTNLETLNVNLAHVDNFAFLENLISLKRIKIEEGYHDDNDGNISKTLRKRPTLHLVSCKFDYDTEY